MSTPNNKDVPPSMKGTAATESARPLGSRTALTYGAAIGVMGLGYWWYTRRNLQDSRDVYRAKDLNPATAIERSLDRDRPVTTTTSYGIKQEKMPAMNISSSTGPVRNESMSERASRVGTDLKDLAAPITDPTSTGMNTAKRAASDLKETVKDTADYLMNKPLDETLGVPSRDTLSDKARDTKDYVREKAYDAKEGMKDTMRRDSRDVKEFVKDKAYDAKEGAKDTMREAKDSSRDTMEYVKDKARDTKEYIKDKAHDAKEGMKDTMRSVSPSRDTKEYMKDKAYDAKETAKDTMRDTKDYIKDKAYDAKEGVRDAKERMKETGYEAKDATRRAADRIEDGARHMRETGDRDRYISEVDKYANMPSDVKDRVLAREQEDWHSVSGNMPEGLRSSVDTKPTASHNAAVKARMEAERDRAIMKDSARGITERAKAAGDFVVEKATEMYHEPFSGSSKKKTSA